MPKELASMRAVEDNSVDTLKAFGDAGRKVFAVEDGSQLFQKPEFEFLDPLSNELEQYGAECVKEPLTGTVNTWLQAPATRGDKPSIDLLLKGLFGRVITTASMSGTAEPAVADGNTVEVTTVDANLQAGMAILIQENSADKVVWVTSISPGTGQGGKDQIFTTPAYQTGQLGTGDIPAGVHYVPKTGGNSGEYPILQIDQLDDPADERYGWIGLKVASASWSSGAGQIIKPSFQILGIAEIKEDPQAGTVTDPNIDNLFVGKNIFIQKDGSDIVWVSTLDVNYNNSLSEIPGAEASGGIAGYAEDRRVITIGLDYKYVNSTDRDAFKAGTRFNLSSYARRNVGTIASPDYRYCAMYCPSLLAEDYNISSPQGKDRKYDLTARAFPATRANEDSLTLSII